MEKYKELIIKAVVIVILIIVISILGKEDNEKAYIPDYEIGLPTNTYYTEEEFGYQEIYIENLMNIFVDSLYSKDFETIYNMLSDETKSSKFLTVEDLKEYFENNFSGIINAEKKDEIFFLELDYNLEDNIIKFDYFVNSKKNDKDEKPGMKITIIEKGPYDRKIVI